MLKQPAALFAAPFAAALSIAATADAQQLPRVLQDWRANPTTSVLHDYSYAGYRGGAFLPPRVEGPVFDVTKYGAVPDDGKDDVDAIQRAIDACAEAGGGVVRFPKGVFDFDVNRRGTHLKVRSSRIVLRGAGTDPRTGTVLHDHTFSDSPSPRQTWLANKIPSFVHAGPFTPLDKSDYNYGPDVPDDAKPLTTIRPASNRAITIEVDDASSLKPGTTYLLAQTDPDNSLLESIAAPLTKFGRNHRRTGIMKVTQLVTIEKVAGNKVTLSSPTRWQLEERWTPALYEVQMIDEVGVESIRFRTNWKGPFRHHASVEGNDGWNHVRFDQVRNGWVRDVVHDGTTMSVMLASTKNCIVMDAKIEGPQGHNGFVVIGAATDNLFLRCDGATAFHTFQIQGNPSGNVFLDCRGGNPSAIDSHGGLGLDNLFDGLVGCVYSGGGADNNVPPRHARGLVFWNWQVGRTNPYNGKPRSSFAAVSEIPGFVAVGVRPLDGQPIDFSDLSNRKMAADGATTEYVVESLGRAAQPKSLYRFQRKARLGAEDAKELPAARWQSAD